MESQTNTLAIFNAGASSLSLFYPSLFWEHSFGNAPLAVPLLPPSPMILIAPKSNGSEWHIIDFFNITFNFLLSNCKLFHSILIPMISFVHILLVDCKMHTNICYRKHQYAACFFVNHPLVTSPFGCMYFHPQYTFCWCIDWTKCAFACIVFSLILVTSSTCTCVHSLFIRNTS